MKKIIFILTVIAVLSLVIFGVCFAVININSSKYIYSDINKLPPAQTAIILGAGVLSDGRLSPILQDRVDMAIKIYKKGLVQKILASGDNSTVSHNEVNPIRNYLLKNGIPDQDIFLDHAGFDTYSSMYRARDIFQVKSAIIVSQAFHLPRAVFIAQRLGMKVYGMEADRGNYLLRNNVRELFGDVKAVYDLILQRQPKYLGPQIPITGDGRDNL